jgi:hypothetical protein
MHRAVGAIICVSKIMIVVLTMKVFVWQTNHAKIDAAKKLDADVGATKYVQRIMTVVMIITSFV